MFLAPYVDIYELLLVGRAVSGFHCGLITGITPVFVTELAPISLRGAAGTINQLTITLGGLIASILGLPAVLGRGDNIYIWTFLFFPCFFLPFLQIVMLLFTVESPKWLLLVANDENQAFASLKKLRGNVPDEVFQDEIAQLRLEKEQSMNLPKLSLCEMAKGTFSWPLAICVMMQLAQQLSGINAAIFYSSEIFSKAGLTGAQPEYASLGVISTSFTMAIVSSNLVERLGRRILMIGGILGMWLASLLVTVFMVLANDHEDTKVFNYITIAMIIFYVASFGIGPGPIPWFIAPELSLSQFRPLAISICTFVNWAANLGVAFAFPPIQRLIGPYSFMPFFVFLNVFLIFSFLFLPETKNQTPENSISKLETRKLQVTCCCRSSSNF